MVFVNFDTCPFNDARRALEYLPSVQGESRLSDMGRTLLWAAAATRWQRRAHVCVCEAAKEMAADPAADVEHAG